LSLAGDRWTLRQSNGRNGNTVDRGTIGGNGEFTLRSADGFAHNEDVGTLRWREAGGRLRFDAVVRARNRDIVQILTARSWTRVR
jgi:hypothetical protein